VSKRAKGGTRSARRYQELYDRACERKGGEKALEGLLSGPRSRRYLQRLPDDRYLAEFTR